MIQFFNQVSNAIFDFASGGRNAEQTSNKAAMGRPPFIKLEAQEVFTDVVILPANDVKEARAAVALQLDRLLPFDHSSTSWDICPLESPSPQTGRRRFKLVAAPHAYLLEKRKGLGTTQGRIEAFSVSIEGTISTRHAILIDPFGENNRQRRRTVMLVAAASFAASIMFLGHALKLRAESLSASLAAATSTQAQISSMALTREMASVQALNDIQSTNTANTTQIALKAHIQLQSLGALAAIERVTISDGTLDIMAHTTKVAELERAVRAFEDFRIISFSATTDPFGRGERTSILAQFKE